MTTENDAPSTEPDIDALAASIGLPPFQRVTFVPPSPGDDMYGGPPPRLVVLMAEVGQPTDRHVEAEAAARLHVAIGDKLLPWVKTAQLAGHDPNTPEVLDLDGIRPRGPRLPNEHEVTFRIGPPQDPDASTMTFLTDVPPGDLREVFGRVLAPLFSTIGSPKEHYEFIDGTASQLVHALHAFLLGKMV